MPLVTFTSDFGDKDHYVALIKGKLLSYDSTLNIIDISHHIESFDLAHAAFVVKNAYKSFPEGTIHLLAIHTLNDIYDEHIVAQIEGHLFVTCNHGLLSLISNIQPSEISLIKSNRDYTGTFPTLDIYVPAIINLLEGTEIANMGSSTSLKRLMNREIRATKKSILGHVVRVDNYGNLITNIDKQTFDFLSKGKMFEIKFGRERVPDIDIFLSKKEPGDCFVIFNSLGLLEIGINQGSASELLGLGYDSPVSILFHEGFTPT